MCWGGSEAYIPATKNSNSTTFSVFLFATCVFVYSYSDSSHLFNIKWPATAAIFRKASSISFYSFSLLSEWQRKRG